MYCNFFGFNERPFEMSADPKYLYLNKHQRNVLDSLVYGVDSKCSLIVLIGEVGTGKTTMLNALRDRLNEKTKVVFIFNTEITFKQMLILALCQLKLIPSQKNVSTAEALQLLNEFARNQSRDGGNFVFIVDEAQNLKKATLENLRLLSNMETRRGKLVQLILAGQPELDYTLNKPGLRNLVQRISIKRYFSQLSEKDTYDYIAHRLKIADYKGQRIFRQESLKLIWNYSKGVPRKINILCNNALMLGYITEKKIIDNNIIREIIRDLTDNHFQKDITGNDFMFSNQP
jgi:general secretion pathway protein A